MNVLTERAGNRGRDNVSDSTLTACELWTGRAGRLGRAPLDLGGGCPPTYRWRAQTWRVALTCASRR